MFLFGVLCLVATTLALPLELPPAPESLITIVPEHELRTNMPQPIEVIKIEKGDIKEDNKEDEAKFIVLAPVPEAPVLPPMHETVREYLSGENKELRILKSRIPNISYPGLPVIEMLGI